MTQIFPDKKDLNAWDWFVLIVIVLPLVIVQLLWGFIIGLFEREK